MGGNGKFLKLKFLSFRGTSAASRAEPELNKIKNPEPPPPEYTCPVCIDILSDPVVVGSGHTLDKLCAQVCLDLNFSPTLPDGSRPDLTTQIPNLALQATIPKWCAENGVVYPLPSKHRDDIEALVRERYVIRDSERFLIDAVEEKPNLDMSHAVTELTHRVNRFDFNSSGASTSSDESVIANVSPMTPLPFKTKPMCWSAASYGSSSTTISEEAALGNVAEDDEIVAKLKSLDPYEQEMGAAALRRVTRDDEGARVGLCTTRVLLCLRSLLCSGYERVQTNAVAALVNLSLAKANKVVIVRAGILPHVIDLLRGRSAEAQEHAAGVIFSLALEEDNKTAIGVLGALPPLLHCLTRSDSERTRYESESTRSDSEQTRSEFERNRSDSERTRSESERTRSDSALALYHLSLVHSNRVKLVKLGAVPKLLKVMREEKECVAGRVLLVLCQLAVSNEGKAAMLDGNAVENLVAMLRREGLGEATKENCVAALFALSHGSMRFKALAKEARAVEVLKEVEEKGSERAKEKARRILVLMKGRRESVFGGDGSEDDVDWEAILESGGGISRSHHRVGIGGNSTDF